MKSLSINIHGDKWDINFLSKEEYIKKHSSSEEEGCTFIYENTIDINLASEDLDDTILHELNHSYMKSLCLGETHSISIDDFEEIMSDYLAKNIFKIMKSFKEIKKKLTKLKK